MSAFLADKYALYVIAAYGVTALVLGGLVFASVLASARARRDLADLEQERRR